MKEFTVCITFGVSFDERGEAYDLVRAFRQFLDDNVPIENFELQDVKLGYHYMPKTIWEENK